MIEYGVRIGIGIVLCLLVVPIIKKLKEKYALRRAYGKFDCLFTKAELKFYYILKGVCQDLGLELFAKVRLADLVKVVSKKHYMKYFGKIKAKHIDYVICHRNTLEPLICIELDDSTHKQKDRMERDSFINQLLHQVGYELIRVPVAYHYSRQALKKQIVEAMK